MAERLPPEMELRCLRALIRAPPNYQRLLRSEVRRILYAAESQAEALAEIDRCVRRVEQRTQHADQRAAESDTGPSARKARVDEADAFIDELLHARGEE